LAKNRKSPFFYGYIIILAAFFVQVLMWGAFNSFGVFFVPLLAEFGWTRAMTSGPLSLSLLLMGLVSIIAGRLNDRFGPRLVVSIFGLVLGLGYLLMSQVSAIWHFYLFYGVMIGIGMGGPDISLLSTVARWFVKKRGMMTGIIKAGAGVGLLIMPLVANWLILTYGWRIAYIVTGLVILIPSISVAQVLKLEPGQQGLLPDGGGVGEVSSNSAAAGFTLRQAVHTRQFWLLCGVYFLFIYCVQTVIVHIYPHAVDLGIPESVAANILAAIGGAIIAGGFIMGSTGDRVGHKAAMIIDLSILATALLWLQLAEEVWMLYIFAALDGFAHGGLYTLISPMVAELFGLRSHGVIFGIVTFIATIGGVIGPVVIGHMFDVTGGYQLGFFILAVACVVAILLSINIKLKPKDVGTR